MNELTKFLIEELLDESKTVALYGGGFKPPTKGHFNVVELALNELPDIDELKVLVGQGVRDGITQEESLAVWNIYKNYLSDKVIIEPSAAPVKSVLNYAKDNPNTKVYWILGVRDGEEGDLEDIARRTKTIDKYPNLEVKVITSTGGVSGTKARNAIKLGNKEQFFHLIPDIKEKEQVWNIVHPVVKEGFMDDIKTKLKEFKGDSNPLKLPHIDTWHDGQYKASNDKTEEAIKLMTKAVEEAEKYAKEKNDAGVAGEAGYYRGTIAWLKKDYNIVKKYINDKYVKITGNDEVLERLLKNKDKSYKEAYNINEEKVNEVDGMNIPQYLYHATYKPLLKKIKEKGLDTSDSKKAWDDSIPGYVYLALDPYVAESYAEESEMVPESWSDNIIILKVDTSKLDKSKLFMDQNVQNNEGDTLEYRGTIPWEALSLQTLNEVGEANLKPYKWEEVDRESYFVYTRFETESETQYDVDLKSTNYVDDDLNNLRALGIEFSAKLKGDEGSSAKIVVNKGEMYRVMSTIVDIVKYYIKKSKSQAILYSPSKKSDEEDFGTQRDNLYRAFISKAFPGVKFKQDGEIVAAILPDAINEADPEKGTGKKPKGSSRRLYTDEDPKDTVSIKFKTKEDIVDTLNKTSFKAKSHARQSQIINVVHQRVRAAYSKAKDPEVKSRLKRALDYIEKRKEMSKKKTERLNKMKEASDPQAGTALPYGSGFAPVKELVTSTEVICDNCGWEWSIKDGGKDLYICHKCEHDNTPALNEGRYDSITNQLSRLAFKAFKDIHDRGDKKGKFSFTVGPDDEDIQSDEFEFDYTGVVEITDDKYTVDGGSNEGFDDKGNEITPLIVLKFRIPQNPDWQKVSFDIKDVVRHELEHLTQDGLNLKGTVTIDDPRAQNDPKLTRPGKYMQNDQFIRNMIDADSLPKANYFRLEKEVDAMLQGMYFKAKKSRTPFKDVINDYFEKVGLEGEDKQDVLDLWTKRLKALNLPAIQETDIFGLNELAKTFVKETFEKTWNLQEGMLSLSKYMIDNGMNIMPLPKIKVIKDDEQNASDLLGKTAYYNPVEKSITLYTMDRHPKDILRSFAHEIVHHEQNLEGRLNNINTTNTNEDGILPEIEKEAYEKGNMMLRNWEDSIKNV